MRLKVDPASSSVTEARQVLGQRTVEFPSVSPAVTGRRHTMMYCTADTVGHDLLWGPAQVGMKDELLYCTAGILWGMISSGALPSSPGEDLKG